MKLKHILTELNSTIIAYHGSPENFDKFERKSSVSGNSDSDIGYWFLYDINRAKKFANAWPKEYYIKLMNGFDINKFIDENKDLLWNVISDFSINVLDTDKFEYIDSSDWIYSVKSYVKKYGYNKLNDNEVNIFDTIINYKKNENEFENSLKKYYMENHKGIVYTCQLKLGKNKILNGEDVGVGNSRTMELSNAIDNGYNSVIIKNGDTGQGIADEIVIFDVNDIKIIKKTYI